MNLLFLLLSLFVFLLPIYAGKVRPYGANSIILSSTNAGDLADYNFTMTLDTDLPSTGFINIIFPLNQYVAGLGLPNDFVVYAPYPNKIVATLDATTTSTATTIKCQVGERKANESFTIEVLNVRNPSKTGGTGNFKIESRFGSKILDINNNFGVVGIFSSSSELLSVSIDYEPGMSQQAGQLTSYILSLVPSVNLPSYIDIKVVFPTVYDFSSIQASQCAEYKGTLGLSLYCQKNTQLKNVVVFAGFSKKIAQGTPLKLLLQNVTNPRQQMTTEALSYWVREVGTNNTIQKSQGVPGLNILAGPVYQVSLDSWNLLFPLYTSFDKELVISFRPSNPFNVIKIGTPFPLVKECTAINGLALKHQVIPIVCSPSSGVMVIKGFQTYSPEDLYLKVVKIKFMATLPSSNIQTNHIEIYTFLDEGYANKVDQDITSDMTQAQITTLTQTSVAAGSSFTSATNLPGASNTLTYVIEPTTTYMGVTSVVIELSRQFKGTPTCTRRDAITGATTPAACTFKNGLLTITVNSQFRTPINVAPNFYVRPRFIITGLNNPTLPKTYNVPIYTMVGTIAVEYYRASFTINTQPITAISMVPLADKDAYKTMYVLKFTTTMFLEDGFTLLAEPNKLSSYIDIEFNMQTSGSASFSDDLGSGLKDRSDYPCETIGMKASVFATKTKCILIKGPSTVTATSVVTIRVVDFNPVLQGTALTINIPLLNTALSGPNPEATVKTYTVKDYTTYLTSEAVVSAIPTTSTDLGTVMTGASSISLVNSSVQAETSIQFDFTLPGAGVVVATGLNASIQIEYPSGYSFPHENITIELNGATVATNLIHFADIFNFLTIQLSTSLNAGAQTLIINNIKTPNASKAAGNDFVVKTLRNSKFLHTITFTTLTVTPGSFEPTTSSMTITPDEPNHLYGAYKFKFTTSKYIPTTSTIQITFPTDYTLDSEVECSEIIGLTDDNSAGSLQCIIDIPTRTITIANFDTLDIGHSIELEIFGITNPSTTTSMDFIVNVLDDSSNTIETLTLSSTLESPSFAPVLDLNVSVARLTPSNPIIPSSFMMTIDPGYQLPKNAILEVQFDNDFGNLYSSSISSIECVAQGGLYTLKQCSITTSAPLILTMVLGETSNASIAIDIHYFGLISYPHDNMVIPNFAVTVTYKGIQIAEATTFPTITSTDEIVSSNSITMDYYPRNEGEQANYLFTIALESTTDLTSSMSFLVRFPNDYDPNLFLYEPVAESQQLIGALHVKVLHRHVRITGFAEMPVTGPITIRLWGIVNPNKRDITRTGAFGFALMEDDNIIEGSFQIQGIIPLLAPDSIQLTSVKSTTLKARYMSDFTFEFLSEKDIIQAQLGGEIFVDFPPDYLIDSYGGKCEINEEFSFFVNCYIDNNRIFINASNPLWTSSMGSLTFMAQNIRTPDNDGEARNFVISNYDSERKRIVSRTYSTLNPASLTYVYDGYLISINDDKPVDVEVGTYTDEIVLKLPGPALQTLTLTPNTLNSTILITPFPLQIQLGERQATFRVAVPRDILLKSFYITWSKTGDSLNPTYANLRRTNLRMNSGLVKRVVAFESMEYIPVGGITFPLLLLTANPPYNELELTLSVQNGDTLASLSKSVISFAQGDFNQNYTIAVDAAHALTNVEILFTISGYDGPSYILENSILTIPIVAAETFLPEIELGYVEKTTRSSATFNFTANTLSFIYYVIAHKSMPIPTFSDVSAKAINQTLEYSKPRFGETYIKRSPKNVTFTVNGLEPGRDYQIYAYIMNLNQIHNDAFYIMDFSTRKPQKIAQFIMEIKQSLLPTDLKTEIRSRLSQMISIETSRLIERVSDCVQTLDSVYYNTPNTSYFHLYLLPDPTNENDMSDPLNLVRNLNARTDEIRQFVPRLADGDLTGYQAVNDSIPEFAVRPKFSLSQYFSLTTLVNLRHCGYLHAIALPVPLSQNSTATELTVYRDDAPLDTYPSSFQIASGLDTQNQPAIYAKLRVNNIANDYAFMIEGLTDNLIYNVYITSENDWPIYNLFLDDKNVARVNAKTIKKRKPLNVYSVNFKKYNVNTGSPLAIKVSWGVLLLMTVLGLFV